MILPGNHSNTLPKIVYEEMEGTIKISGRSLSDEVEEYFEEFLSYLKDNLRKNPIDMQIRIDLEFFNTRTARLLMKFLNILCEFGRDKGKNIKVFWYYEEDDADLLEAGKDYQYITRLDFEYIEKSID